MAFLSLLLGVISNIIHREAFLRPHLKPLFFFFNNSNPSTCFTSFDRNCYYLLYMLSIFVYYLSPPLKCTLYKGTPTYMLMNKGVMVVFIPCTWWIKPDYALYLCVQIPIAIPRLVLLIRDLFLLWYGNHTCKRVANRLRNTSSEARQCGLRAEGHPEKETLELGLEIERGWREHSKNIQRKQCVHRGFSLLGHTRSHF